MLAVTSGIAASLGQYELLRTYYIVRNDAAI
jgi:hypothetical protein